MTDETPALVGDPFIDFLMHLGVPTDDPKGLAHEAYEECQKLEDEINGLTATLEALLIRIESEDPTGLYAQAARLLMGQVRQASRPASNTARSINRVRAERALYTTYSSFAESMYPLLEDVFLRRELLRASHDIMVRFQGYIIALGLRSQVARANGLS